MIACGLPAFEYEPASLAGRVFPCNRRVLLYGEPGIGKSTLAAALAKNLAVQGRSCWCIDADPGTPSFGIPGTVCLGRWRENGWELVDLVAMCSLDAGRFRLPLASAVRRLMVQIPSAALLVDAPGVVRGVAGAELLAALLEAAVIDAVVVLVREKGRRLRLREELRAAASCCGDVAGVCARSTSRRRRGTIFRSGNSPRRGNAVRVVAAY